MAPPNAGLGWMEHTVAEATNCSKPVQGSVLGGKTKTISAGSQSSFRASDVAQANSQTCSAGMDHDLFPPSEWRAIVIKLDELGQP